MNVRLTLILVLAFDWWPASGVRAEDTFPPILYAAEGAGKIIKYDGEGKVIWEYPAEMARDVWALPNGHVLFCFNRDYDSAKQNNPSGVVEVTAEKKVVFSFSTTGQIWSCQRMADGNTLLGAASQGKLLIIDPRAKLIKTIHLLSPAGHSCLRNARQIANGHFLVAEESAHAAREYSAEGKLVREIKLAFAPYSVVRLENGNTVICGQQSMIEVDPGGKTVWSVEGSDLPHLGVRWFAGVQVLPNNDIFVCNAGGKVPFFELSRDKRILWQSPSTLSVPLGHGIQRLDIDGPLLK